jgi:hypothetical protein
MAVTLESTANITITQASHLSFSVAILGLSLDNPNPRSQQSVSMHQHHGAVNLIINKRKNRGSMIKSMTH